MTHPKMKMTILTLTTLTRLQIFSLFLISIKIFLYLCSYVL